MKRAVTLAAFVLLLLGFAASRFAAAAEAPHFHSASRSVVIENRTGNGAWSAAITHAAEAWNRAGVVHITHVTGTGDCESVVRGRLLFCQRPAASMGGAQGWAYPYAENDHLVGGRAWGCSDCASDARKRVVATHEIGHLLGLGHTSDPGSVMCTTGCAEAPNQADLDALRSSHTHSDSSSAPADLGATPHVPLDGLPKPGCTLVCL